MNPDELRIALAQIAPVWLDKAATLKKIVRYVEEAGNENCNLVVFSEGLLPGYPFWIEHTGGASFESEFQKEMYAHYLDQAVRMESDLDGICKMARKKRIHVVLGVIEAAKDRGGHSVYASMVYIDDKGEVRNVHRKLMPTYEERLVWAQGDGHGLQTFTIGKFTMGGLNCWENWMPLPRTALYSMGEDLHLAIWPGSVRNTEDITPFIAREGRSYAISVSGLMRKTDIPDSIPHYDYLVSSLPEVMGNGGSCVATPRGKWLLEPVADEEGLFIADLDHREVRKERQNFDPAGHYSRPDVLRLSVDRTRQGSME